MNSNVGKTSTAALLLSSGLLALCLFGAPLTAQQDGSLDTSFDPGTGANDPVYDVAWQPDGKVLIVGGFASYDGTARNHIARLNPDGSLDTSFDPGSGTDDLIYDVALQPDGKVLIGGDFTSFDGAGRNSIARLNTDGSLDSSFDPGTGVDLIVYKTALQPDGKVLVAGVFTTVDGTSRSGIARLNADGSLDTGFDPGTGTDVLVSDVVVQPDDKIVIGGSFTTFDGVARDRVARLNADGSVDTTFDPGSGADNPVLALTLQPDDKILIGGAFEFYDGVARSRIARLNADGSLDTGFDPGLGTNGDVHSIVLQQDDKVLIGGNYTSFDGVGRNGLARLDTDGSLDTNFNPGVGANNVRGLELQGDGKLLVCGYFTSYDGIQRDRVARVYNSAGPTTASPQFTSTPATSGAEGRLYVYAATADGNPAPTLVASGLPGWLTFDSNNDILIGTPTVAGTYGPITITASNGTSTDAVQSFSIEVGVVPQFTSTPVTAGTVGSSYAYTATADGTPAPLLSTGGLPWWLNFNVNTGELTGTPTVEGIYGPITITASNGLAQDDFQSFTIEVGVPPQITSTPVTTGTVESAYTYTVAASGTPAPTLSATGLPGWLSFDDNSGELTGTPEGDGVYGPITITAANGFGADAIQTFSIDISEGSDSDSGDNSSTGGGCSVSVRAGGLPLGVVLVLALLVARQRRRTV